MKGFCVKKYFAKKSEKLLHFDKTQKKHENIHELLNYSRVPRKHSLTELLSIVLRLTTPLSCRWGGEAMKGGAVKSASKSKGLGQALQGWFEDQKLASK